MSKNDKTRVMPRRKHPEEPHWDNGNYVKCPLSRPDRLMGMCKFGSQYNGEITCHMAHGDSLGVNVKRLSICPMRERSYEALKKKKQLTQMHEAQQHILEDLEGDFPFA